MRAAEHLRIVTIEEPASVEPALGAARRRPDGGDLALVAALFLVNLLPVAGELLRIGRWSPAVVGFAAGALLLTGRELWSQVRARAGRNTDGRGTRP